MPNGADKKSKSANSSSGAITTAAKLVDEVRDIIEIRCSKDNAVAFDWLLPIFNPLESRILTGQEFQNLKKAQGKYDEAQENYDEKFLNQTLTPDGEQDLLSAEQDLLSAEQDLLSVKREWMNRFLVNTKNHNTKKNIPTLQKFIKKYGNWKPYETVKDKDNWLSAYNDTFIPFVGREEEINLLNAFVETDDDTNFKLWALVGPSGAGKTRLLVHWGNSGILAGWDVKHLSARTKLDLDDIKRPTFISIDYIYGYDEVIADIISAAREKKFAYPVRLLLLDHATPDKLSELLNDPRYGLEGMKSEEFGLIREKFFFKDAPLKLEVSAGEEGNQFLSEIICEISKREAGDPEIIKGIRYLNDTKGARQPLFAALVGDAILRRGTFEGQNRRALIEGYLNDRHRITWLMDKPDSVYQKGTWAACFIAAATARRGADYRTLFDGIPDGYQADKDHIQRDLKDFKALCAGVVSSDTTTHLKQFEPDILGESHFLLLLESIKKDLWGFETVLPALISAGNGEVVDEAAVEFVAFITRLARNLLNDDQEAEETKSYWKQLKELLKTDRFLAVRPMCWAISCASIEIAKLLEAKGMDALAVHFFYNVNADDLYKPPQNCMTARHIALALLHFKRNKDRDTSLTRSIIELLATYDRSENADGTALILTILSDVKCLSSHLLEQNLENKEYLSIRNNQGWTALILACAKSEEELALKLVATNANLSAANVEGMTALMYACLRDLKSVAHELIKAGVNLSAQKQDGWTALMFACDSCLEDLAILLIERNANISAFDYQRGWTALMLACWFGQEQVALKLIERGANPSTQHVKGWTALMIACQRRLERVAHELIKVEANLSAQKRDGWTALMFACNARLKDLANLLVEKDANLSAYDYQQGWTALMLACWHKQEQIALKLIERGAALNAEDAAGRTALMVACEKGLERPARELIKLEANLSAQNVDGWTALMFACHGHHEELADLLIEKGANLSAFDTQLGWTALLLACWSGQEQLALKLIERGADPCAEDADGETALIFACKERLEQAAISLIEKNVKIEKKDKDGWTALMLACRYGLETAALKLIEKKASLLVSGPDGETPLTLACAFGLESVALKLIEGGADIDAQTTEKWTSLMYACSNNMESVAQKLIENDANLSVQDGNGVTALMLACVARCEAVAIRLIDAKVALSEKNKDGVTALMFACRYGQNVLVDKLVEANVDIDVQDVGGVTALMLACLYRHEKIALKLIKAGADPSPKGDNDLTALMLACRSGLERVALSLTEIGVGLSSQDSDDNSALIYACDYRLEPVALKLIEKGVELDAVNKSGYSALLISVLLGLEKVVAKLIEFKANLNSIYYFNGMYLTPLQVANLHEQKEIVEMLEKAGAGIFIPFET